MNLNEYVSHNKPLLKNYLINILEKKKKEDPIFYNAATLDKLVEFSTNGKMLRGLIVCMVSEMFGKNISDEVLGCASAIEINHSALLIHDDIIDNDYLRRGNPTIFAQFMDEGKEKNVADPRFYGISMGLCAGDVALFLGPELLVSGVFSPDTQSQIIRLFYHEMRRVALAEMYEFDVGQTSYEPNKMEIEDIYRYKTARYTFSLPMMLGGLIAEVEDKTLTTLESFGEELGIVFQMKDDELGLLGNEEDIGKPVGSDIRENKKTLIRLLLLQSVSEEERRSLDSLFGSSEVTKEQIQYVRDLSEKYSIINKIQDRINSVSDTLENTIESFPIDTKHKNLLREFVVYNAERSV